MPLAESNAAEVVQWIMCGLGALGFVAALGSLYWQHWQYRDFEKMKLEVEASQVGIPGWASNTIFMDVWNTGRVRIWIDSVHLVCTTPAAVGGGSVADSYGVPLISDESFDAALEPGQRRHYRMEGDQSAVMKTMAEAPTDTVYLSIKGGGKDKELLRLPGREVHGIVRGIWASIEREEKLRRKAEDGKIGT